MLFGSKGVPSMASIPRQVPFTKILGFLMRLDLFILNFLVSAAISMTVLFSDSEIVPKNFLYKGFFLEMVTSSIYSLWSWGGTPWINLLASSWLNSSCCASDRKEISIFLRSLNHLFLCWKLAFFSSTWFSTLARHTFLQFLVAVLAGAYCKCVWLLALVSYSISILSISFISLSVSLRATIIFW